MELFLSAILPNLMNNRATFSIHAHQGKMDLFSKLGPKLKAYQKWIPENFRIVVLVDRDDDDCSVLKSRMEDAASAAGLLTRSVVVPGWQIVNRIAVEELEAWFFGAWKAVRDVYTKVPTTIPHQSQYRDCDDVKGGTWEAFERILQRAGYFSGGLRKGEAASEIGRRFDPATCKSKSFIHLRETILEALR